LKPKLITFDCANTLIWTDWQPHTFALRCAKLAGLELPENAGDLYLKLFVPKVSEFWKVNQTRSVENWRAFWVQQVTEWLEEMGLPSGNAFDLHMIGEREIFEVPSATFRRFDDAIPCLNSLKSQGYKLAVLSNWDVSLHGCLAAHSLTNYFDAVFASLEEGVEKPDQRLFQIVLDHFQVSASETFHVGDDWKDDVEGAKNAGIPVAWLDRSATVTSKPTISSLNQLEEAFTWYD
jgi:HAD superfamily hydrolase (TIGR01549 family)